MIMYVYSKSSAGLTNVVKKTQMVLSPYPKYGKY